MSVETYEDGNPSGPRELAVFAHDLGQKSRELKVVEVRPFPAGDVGQLALIPEGCCLLDVAKALPWVPERKKVAIGFTSAESYTAYVNEQKSKFSRIFARLEAEPYEFNAIIDWHGTAGEPADWCQHQAKLVLKYGYEFRKWLEKNDKFMTQQQFSEWLKDWRHTVSLPCGSTMLELVMALEATDSVRVKGKVQTNSGCVVSYESEIRTNVPIPDTITLSLPMFEGGEPVDIDCDLKFRITDGHGVFAVRMLGIEAQIRQAVKQLAGKISAETLLPVYI